MFLPRSSNSATQGNGEQVYFLHNSAPVFSTICNDLIKYRGDFSSRDSQRKTVRRLCFHPFFFEFIFCNTTEILLDLLSEFMQNVYDNRKTENSIFISQLNRCTQSSKHQKGVSHKRCGQTNICLLQFWYGFGLYLHSTYLSVQIFAVLHVQNMSF